MRWLEDQFGEKDLILAFVDLEIIIRTIIVSRSIARLQEIYTYFMKMFMHRRRLW